MPFAPLPPDQDGVRYLHGPDSSRRAGVPEGSVVEHTWTDSAVFPGTTRRYWVHVPAPYDPRRPAALMVFQDGDGFLDPDDEMRAATVLDNLVDDGAVPVTISVFVEPGTAPAGSSRNAEYDAFDDRYARLLADEIIPEVRKRWAVTDDHDQWGIGGFSSGGSCAFTAAWLRPDLFGRVLGFSSSFPQVASGTSVPELVAGESRPPLRVFLQVGRRDLGWDEPRDNWFAENLRVAAALAEAGHDVRLVIGDGGHDANHAGVLLPDALRWLWRTPLGDRAAL
ncbi:enterochelin esterase [Nocardioides currus]|uniref:Enterochelin esterase n=1 Tax=Nocardioides currus TaxID=2133958 RepID=A0A2R7YSK6_9ACTN|nr:enterochelin esterase [Nocardioides currus]